MPPNVNKAVSVAGPIAMAGAISVKGGVARYASATSNTSVALPSSLHGSWIRIKSVGVATDWAFSVGTSGATLVKDQAAVAGTGSAAAGETLDAGESIEVLVPVTTDGRNVYLNFISGATGGFVTFRSAQSVAGVI